MPTPLRGERVTLKPTAEQQEILDQFMSGETTVASALAGTGKTSTLIMCCKARTQRGAYLAFNKAIAEEAADRMPPRVIARTASSFAYRGVIEDMPWIPHRLHKKVAPWIMASHLGITGRFEIRDHQFSASKMANLTADMVSNFCASDDTEVSKKHVPFVRGLEAVRSKESPHEILIPDSHPDLATALLPYARNYWDDVQFERGQLRFSFDHFMKVWALGTFGPPELPGEYVLVDEAQDLSEVEIGLLRRMDKQLLVVGDANQQIYEFRGSVNAMDRFGVDKFDQLPLTMSFRFGNEIAETANIFLRELHAPNRISGNPYKISAVWNRDDAIAMAPSAILTRSNAGALEMLLLELDRGMAGAIAVTGRIKSMRSFIEAVHKMQQGQIVTHPDLLAFATWEDVQDYVAQTQDRDYALLVKMIDLYGADRLAAALDATCDLSDAELAISTAHSAKGLEWDRVRIGNDFESSDGEAEVKLSDSETRLAYVAVTRAIEELDTGGLTRRVFGA